MKKVLITGANGFVGHFLVEEFLKDNEVVCLVRPNIKNLHRLAHLKNKIQIIEHDIREPLSNTLKDISVILHAAGNPSSDESLRDPVGSILNNIVGTTNLLEFSKRLNLQRFVYYSAGECLGPTTLEKESKETDAYNCRTIYSATKAGAGDMCSAYSYTHNIPVSIIHVTNTFGERSQVNRFPITVIKKVLNNETLNIHRDFNLSKFSGISGRRWFHCKDLALQTRVILKEQKTKCEKWNSAGSKFLTNLDFARLIANSIRKPLNYKLVETDKKGNEPYFIPSPIKLIEHGWIEPMRLDDRVKEVVDWYMTNRSWLNE